MLRRALAGDEVCHRLGLAEVHLAVQEGSLGELARSCKPSTRVQQGL